MTWCRQHEERCNTWTELGGVPDDQSTREVAAMILLDLWAHHQALKAACDDILASLDGES